MTAEEYRWRALDLATEVGPEQLATSPTCRVEQWDHDVVAVQVWVLCHPADNKGIEA